MNSETQQLISIGISENQHQLSGSTLRLVEIPQACTPVNLQNVQDFSNVCRVCATITEFIVPIFSGEGVQYNLAEKIYKYLPIKVSEGDFLPQVVCYQCANQLLAWHEVVQCCVQADVALRSRIPADKKTDDVNKEPKVSIPHPTIQENSQSQEDSHILDDTDNSSDHSDNKPLSIVADKKSNYLYANFYKALFNFKIHLANEHSAEACYPDFTDTSSSEIEENNVDSFDDLTQSNMRKDSMDEDTRLELTQAQTKINGKVFYTCRICGKNLSSSHTYVFHKRIHTGERPCVCHVCGKQFRAPNGLQRHLTETHERLRRYTCSLCPKNFANSQNLKQHLRIHTGERPFVCSHCGKRFTQSGSLYVHLKTHSELFPYHCAECGAKFRLRSRLARHRLKHTGERPHACTYCGKGFRQRHELNSHSLSHSDSKPFACSSCGATFRQRRALRHHAKRIHGNDATPGQGLDHVGVAYTHVAPAGGEVGGEGSAAGETAARAGAAPRTSRCGVCNKSVAAAARRRHERLHGEKRYSCHACGRLFADGANLARHVRGVHERARPHACATCRRAFSRRAHLREHERSHLREHEREHLREHEREHKRVRMREHEREHMREHEREHLGPHAAPPRPDPPCPV